MVLKSENMKYTIRRAYEWLFPDDICNQTGQVDPIGIDLPRNSSEAVQILADLPWADFKSATINTMHHTNGITATVFSLLPVWVEKNTGPAGYTAFPGDDTEHVILTAPFYVYDVIVPLKDGVQSIYPAKSAFYLRFDVESACIPGEYRFILSITSKSEKQIQIPILLHVYSAEIPVNITLKTSNWFNLQNIALRHNCELWSEEFWKMTKQYVALMERVHQNCFLLPFSAVECHRENEKWTFNFNHAKRLIEIFIRHGMQILECGPVVRQIFLGDAHFHLLIDDSIRAISNEGLLFIEEFYKALHHFLLETGYLELCIFHVADEPFDSSIREYEALADQIKRLIPTARLVDAVCTSSIKKYPDIPIPDEKRYEEDYSVFAEIQKQREVWFYTCALPGGKFCNRLLDIPLIKTRIMYWGAAKYRLSGYLHWGFNCYRLGQNPYTDLCPRFSAVHEERYLPPGDTHLVYPGPEGPYSSVRLEQIRKGIEDFEILTKALIHRETDATAVLERGMSGFSEVCSADDFPQIYRDLLLR